ncbi:NADPH-dependent FMN reductase [Rhodoferax mekongensis]|jgi:FMN reductase|uniref:NADPH-dependent FMN reductase n=1 Tax=Rhodoferax mekongensis TaxID=3068341 RepID=A0ABZ0B117_9BURK|nr:NADPH-dependent FMN reductase [Rhodoferax sp. TBRC 17307]NBX20601.1 FMN reductase (NADPH) [Betaproteobacteria bacterium]WNO05315.1 NADPH-dependent FMN reductase [Rhodoferax sp. TBRC 17307]
MSVLLIAGSPSERSRTAALLEAAGQRLEARGVLVDRLRVRDLSPQALLLADFGHPSVSQATGQVAEADVIIVATPVYKAAYSGVLKVFLDLLPQDGFKGKVVLPLATGGSPHHMLALDYSLRPVLQSLGAKHILPGIYATDSQVTVNESGSYQVSPDIGQRIDDAVNTLITETLQTGLSIAGRFPSVAFSEVRCSV